jgi:hypothetical protein
MTHTANAGHSMNSAASVSNARGGGVGKVNSRGEAEIFGQSVVEAESVGEALARGRGTTQATSLSQGSADATMQGLSTAHGTNANYGSTHQRSKNTTVGQTSGVTPGENETEGWTETRSIVPFHELHKRWKVASREFLSLQDFLTTKLNQLSSAKRAHWVIQPPEGKALFIKASTVRPLPGGKERLPAMYRVVFDRPAWRAAREVLLRMLQRPVDALDVRVREVEDDRLLQEQKSCSADAPTQPLIPEVLRPAQADGGDMTDEDFLQ